MKHSIPTVLLAAAMSLASHTTQASEPPAPATSGAHVPDTDAARKSAGLIAKAERVLGAYLAACTAGETPALEQITTIDLRVDQALEEPGAFLTSHGSTAAACDALGADGARLEDYWILPTNDETAVFVHAEGRLALLELRDERIARVVNYGSAPSAPGSSAAYQTAVDPAVRCARVKETFAHAVTVMRGPARSSPGADTGITRCNDR